jgi:hypothetical protein
MINRDINGIDTPTNERHIVMSQEFNCNHVVPKGTLTPLSKCDDNLKCLLLVPSWTRHGVFCCDWDKGGGACKRKRQFNQSRDCISEAHQTNLDKLFREIRHCDVCARDVLWSPSLQHQYFYVKGPSMSQKSIAESLPRFVELHIPCPTPLPCSFCMMKGSKPQWCGSLYCSKTCQTEAENGVSTPGPNLPPPKLYFCRNRFVNDTTENHFDMVNEIRNSLSAIENRLQSICGYDASDLRSNIHTFHPEECALLLTTMIGCLCPDRIGDQSFNDRVSNSTLEHIDSHEASLVEEFWAMSRTFRSVFDLFQKRNSGRDATANIPFPCYTEFLHRYLDIKRSCIVRVDASVHPLAAYATRTVTSSLTLSESDRELALNLLMHEIDLPTPPILNNDPIYRWRNAAHLAHWFSQSTCADGIASRGVQTHLQKSYFAFSQDLFRRINHSCVPTVALTGVNGLAWLALHNYSNEEMTISKLESLDGDLHSRSAELKLLMGCNFVCTCERCRYEAATDDVTCFGEANSSAHFCREHLKRLGDLAMQQGRFEDASKLYDSILLSHPHDGDVLHARAASYLGRASSVSYAEKGHCNGFFTFAQQLWSKAGQESSTHPDIAVQVKKQLAYKTLDDKDHVEIDEVSITFTSLLDGKCHVTTDPIISKEECHHVINKAENYAATEGNGGWTTSRHYAVPTTDLPLYELKELHTWFYNLWCRTIRPLLRLQFKLKSNTDASEYTKRDIFLHDAFVVRYDADKQRYLPSHYDESTHSFIVTLNDDFRGGGTYLHLLGKSIAPPPGGMMSFCGGELLHSGDPVIEGVRYIIAAFCYVDLYGDKDYFTKESNSLVKKTVEPFSFGFSV